MYTFVAFVMCNNFPKNEIGIDVLFFKTGPEF